MRGGLPSPSTPTFILFGPSGLGSAPPSLEGRPPHGSPGGARVGNARNDAGVVHVLQGRAGGWPALIDTAALPAPSLAPIAEIQGAFGDVLCYSGAVGDVDGDGKSDLIVNEMLGDGTSQNDVGNLIVIDGTAILSLFHDGFESGNTSAWTRLISSSPW